MRNSLALTVGLVAAIYSILPGMSAQAQNYRSYVATYGSGTACTRTAPCLSFQGAHTVTNEGGEISCLDSGDFGGGTITKSLTIDCSNTIATAYYAIDINVPGGLVILRGITVLGNGIEPFGIDIRDGSVLIEKCQVNGYRTSSAIGIRFAPSSAGAELLIDDCSIAGNGNADAGGGLEVRGGHATLTKVRFSNNRRGLAVYNRSTVLIRNSTVTGQTDAGIFSRGASAVVRVADSTVSGNRIGLASVSGGQIISHRGNVVADNKTDGAFTSIVNQQ
jgi:hypothetical protein